MKKLFVLLGATLSLAACASDYELDEGYMEEPCPYQKQAQAPQPAPVYQPAPVAQPVYAEYAAPAPQMVYAQPAAPCCQGELKTVREPVEVVYKRTTYGTVYEPRHFENVAYERQSVNGGAYYQPQYVQPVVDGQEYYVPARVQKPVSNASRYNTPVVVVPVQ